MGLFYYNRFINKKVVNYKYLVRQNCYLQKKNAMTIILYKYFTGLAESLAFNLYNGETTEVSRFRIGIGVYTEKTALTVRAYLPSTYIPLS